MNTPIEVKKTQSSRKGRKALRNSPLYYDEVKKKLNLTLTPSTKDKLKAKAKQEGCSISQLIEYLVRGGILDDVTIISDADEGKLGHDPNHCV